MARVALTDEEVARILGAPKLVAEDLKWQQMGDVSWARCDLSVQNQLKLTLHVYANAHLVDRRKYGFSLILSRNYRIASFESAWSHQNRHTDTNRWLSQPHKHRWAELCRDSFAYTPTDIDTSSLEAAFRSFCKETGVDWRFRGRKSLIPTMAIRVGAKRRWCGFMLA